MYAKRAWLYPSGLDYMHVFRKPIDAPGYEDYGIIINLGDKRLQYTGCHGFFLPYYKKLTGLANTLIDFKCDLSNIGVSRRRWLGDEYANNEDYAVYSITETHVFFQFNFYGTELCIEKEHEDLEAVQYFCDSMISMLTEYLEVFPKEK